MDRHTSFISLHSHPIVERLAVKRNITKKHALSLYYNSDLYKIYEAEDTKLWHFSSVTLAEMLDRELATGKLDFPVEG